MTESNYIYSISTDTLNSKVVASKLATEIQSSDITVSLTRVDTSGDVLDIVFKDILDSVDGGILDTVVAAHDGIANESIPKNPDGIQLVDVVFRQGIVGSISRTVVSHEFSDRTTWYQKSIRVTNEVLSEDSSGLTWSSINSNWIDIHGSKLTIPYNKVLKRDGTYGNHSEWEVVVTVDDIVQTSGYTVDFVQGQITFDSSQSGSVVKATYSHNNGVDNRSEFIFSPGPGRKVVIEHVECQFSKSTVFNNPFRFEIWAGNTLSFFDSIDWSTAYYNAGYGQYRMDYRHFNDFINIGNLGTGTIPLLAGNLSEICVFPFNYVKAVALKSSQLSCIRIVLLNDDVTTDCDLSTVTFYLEDVGELS